MVFKTLQVLQQGNFHSEQVYLPKGDIAEDRPKISLFRKAGRMAPEPVTINCERSKQYILSYSL